MKVVFDMETHDPDDYLTLLLLLGHPDVELQAVTITPGSRWQVRLVPRVLAEHSHDIPVGARNLSHEKPCVSSWHAKAYGEWEPSDDAVDAGALLVDVCDEGTTLITGAPVLNLGVACESDDFVLGRWIAQGGFAGEGVVPTELQMEKFAGRTTMATFNLGGAPKAALAALVHPGIGERRFISKNVCHRVVYDEAFHERFATVRTKRPSLDQIWIGMEAFLKKKRLKQRGHFGPTADPIVLIDDGERREMTVAEAQAIADARGLDVVEVASHVDPPICRIMKAKPNEPYGKKLHDPLAACCAIEPDIGTWREVELFRKKGKWGSRLKPGSNTWIIIDYNAELFFETLTR